LSSCKSSDIERSFVDEDGFIMRNGWGWRKWKEGYIMLAEEEEE